MKTLSKKLQDILLGDVGKFLGGKPLRANLSYPLLGGGRKEIYWAGNLGLILTMWEKIEELEKEIKLLTRPKSKK